MNNTDEQAGVAEINRLHQELKELATDALDRAIRLGELSQEEAERRHKAVMSTMDAMVDLILKQFELQRMYPELSNVFPETACMFGLFTRLPNNKFRHHLFRQMLADIAECLFAGAITAKAGGEREDQITPAVEVNLANDS
jgi:hypothetical protein